MVVVGVVPKMAENEPRTHARQPGGTPERGEAVRRRSESSESSDDEAADRRWHEKTDMHFVAVGGAFEVEETMFRTGFRGAATPRRSSVVASRRRRGDDTGTSRGGVAAAARIVRGRVAATPRRRHGLSVVGRVAAASRRRHATSTMPPDLATLIEPSAEVRDGLKRLLK